MFSKSGKKLWKTMSEIGSGVADLVYPSACLVCSFPDSPPLCERCVQAFTPLSEPVCPRCGRSGEPDSEAPCRTCAAAQAVQGDWAFDLARTADVFEGPMRHAIHRLKYNGCESLGPLLGAYLANRIVVDELLPPTELARIDGVVAVPMHPAKERVRGFNQARLLAIPVAEMLGVPLIASRIVVRARRRPAQVGLSPNERRRNLEEAFRVSEKRKAGITGRHLLIVDDVFTTGGTVHACAAALRNAGAASLIVVTLAGGG